MITIQAIHISLHKAIMWFGFAVSGGWLGRSNLECLDSKNYFNLEINTNEDNRPKPISDRPQTVEALSKKYKREVQKPSHCT